jgi:hypothetical protein
VRGRPEEMIEPERDRRFEISLFIVIALLSQFGLALVAALTDLGLSDSVIMGLLLVLIQVGFSQLWDSYQTDKTNQRRADNITNAVLRTEHLLREVLRGEQELFGRLLGALQIEGISGGQNSSAASPYLREHVAELVAALTDTLRGDITLRFDREEQLWTDHMRCLRLCDTGSQFLATCLIHTTAFLDNAVFQEYCALSYEMVRSCKLSSLKKILIIPTRVFLDDAKVRNHLECINTHRRELGDERLDFRVLILDELGQREPQAPNLSDFMIFGQGLLVFSLFEGGYLVNGLRLVTDAREIERMTDEFSRLFARSLPPDHVLP